MFLTTKDVTNRLKISRTKLHYMRQNGDFIPATVIGRSVRFAENDFAVWLGDRTGRSTPAQNGKRCPSTVPTSS